jgi:hypothetical protein
MVLHLPKLQFLPFFLFYFLMLYSAGYCKHERKQCRGSCWESIEPTIIIWVAGVIWDPKVIIVEDPFPFCICFLWFIFCIVKVSSIISLLPLLILRVLLDCLSAGTHSKSRFLQARWKGISRLLCHSHMCAQEGVVQVYTAIESGEFFN